MIPYILAICLNICLALAAARTSAPAGALIVSKAPSKGQYSKVQDAVNALSTSSTTAQSIFIEAGTYSEQVYIAPRKAALTIYGYSTNTDDYNQNVVTITQKKSLNDVATDDLTATLRAWSTNFKLYNVNLVNSYGNGGQALAVNAAASVRTYPLNFFFSKAELTPFVEPRLLRLQIHRFPRHNPRSNRYSVVRKILHRRCYRFHLWSTWPSMVHSLRHPCSGC
jgi:hypothetical protein